VRHLDKVDDRTLDQAIVGIGERPTKDERQAKASGPVAGRQPPVIDQDAKQHHHRDGEESQREVLEQAEGGPSIPGYGQKKHVVEHLTRSVGHPEATFDVDLGHTVDRNDHGGDRDQDRVARRPTQDAPPGPR